jgi:hypothetical protein
MKISKMSALVGGGIVAVEAYVSLTQWIPEDSQFLAEYFSVEHGSAECHC